MLKLLVNKYTLHIFAENLFNQYLICKLKKIHVMKKFYFFTVALMATFMLNAQVNVTFQVDMTDYLKTAGYSIRGVRIAGTFGTLGATSKGTAMSDWSPINSPAFTKVAGSANTWEAKITFPNPAKGQELLFKFLNIASVVGAEWGDCDVDNECFEKKNAGPCNQGLGDFNRVYKIPTAAAVYGYKWNTCTSLTTRALDLDTDTQVSISPNPAADFSVVEITEGVGAYSIEVATVTGQSVQRFENITDKAIIEGLDAGLYFVTIKNAEGKFQTQKLIIE